MAAAPAQGVLRGERVHVADVAQANRLHNKGAMGTPTPGNALDLSLVEAAYCLAEGRLAVAKDNKPVDVADLLALGAQGGHLAEVHYFAYRDLRERGLVVRHAPGVGHFDVWPRGTAQGKPDFQVKAVAEADAFTGDDLAQGAPGALVLAVVDADGLVTHYRLGLDEPKGDVPDGQLPTADGRLLADRVLVTDAAARKAYAKEFLGVARPEGTYVSFLEAEALRRRGALRLPADAVRRAGASDAHFAAVLPVHLDLRARGVVAKSGLRFGAHLRGYRGDPDEGHAEWLIHCCSGQQSWSDVARGVRLAHGVRKKFLAAVPSGTGAIQYVHVAWARL